MILHYKMKQALLQNITAVLLQNAKKFYYKMCQVFYYKLRKSLKSASILLQNATVTVEPP